MDQLPHQRQTRPAITLQEARKAIGTFCKACGASADLLLQKPSDAFLSELAAKSIGWNTAFYCEDAALLSTQEFRLRHGSLPQKCNAIVRAANGAIHYTSVAAVLAKRGHEEMNPLRVHAYLTNSDSLLLWDRGMFIHRDNVQYDARFIQTFIKHLCSRLSKGLPFLSSYGLFKEFGKEITSAGIPSDRALHSTIRAQSGSHLACGRYGICFCASAFVLESSSESTCLNLASGKVA